MLGKECVKAAAAFDIFDLFFVSRGDRCDKIGIFNPAFEEVDIGKKEGILHFCGS